ncbi:MAG: DNA-processing protein DprA [Pseudomonadota bacterium]
MNNVDSWKGMRKFIANESTTDILRLIRSENVGPVTFFNLVHQFGSAKKALEKIPELAARGGKRTPILCYTKKDAENEIEKVEKIGGKMLRYGDAEYPELLLSIYDPPPILTILGSAHIWKNNRNLAIVGSRNASANGFQFAKKLANDAGERGLTVVSGLARGIDTAAHTGSLASGTVAVIASGIDIIYPPENKALCELIRKQGVVVTEQQFGASPHPRSFPARNRIISGISLGTVVVEASLKSGSLITSRFALEQGREVFAVPGSPLDPRCKGTNSLIKQGAGLCESIEDIMHSIGREQSFNFREKATSSYIQVAEPAKMSESELNEARKIVLAKLSFTPVLIDEILIQCDVNSGTLSLVLLELELAGRLQRLTGHKVVLRAEE